MMGGVCAEQHARSPAGERDSGPVWVRTLVRFGIAGKIAAKAHRQNIGGPKVALRAPATSVDGVFDTVFIARRDCGGDSEPKEDQDLHRSPLLKRSLGGTQMARARRRDDRADGQPAVSGGSEEDLRRFARFRPSGKATGVSS